MHPLLRSRPSIQFISHLCIYPLTWKTNEVLNPGSGRSKHHKLLNGDEEKLLQYKDSLQGYDISQIYSINCKKSDGSNFANKEHTILKQPHLLLYATAIKSRLQEILPSSIPLVYSRKPKHLLLQPHQCLLSKRASSAHEVLLLFYCQK